MKRKSKNRKKKQHSSFNVDSYESVFKALSINPTFTIKELVRKIICRASKDVYPSFDAARHKLNCDLAMMDAQGADESYSYFNSMAMTFSMAAEILDRYRKFYIIADKLWELATDTNPDKLRLSDLKLPFPFTILKFETPKNLLDSRVHAMIISQLPDLSEDMLTELGNYISSVIGTLGEPFHQEYAAHRIDFLKECVQQRRNGLCVFLIKSDEDKLPVTDMHLIASHAGDDSTVEDAIEGVRKNVHAHATNFSEEHRLVQWDFIRSIMAYLAFLRLDDVSKTSKGCGNVHVPNTGVVDCTLNQLTHVWKGVKSVAQLLKESAQQRRSCEGVVRHWRGGHLKMQPHGPRNSLRKLIYVEPYQAGGKLKKKDEPAVA